MLIDDKIFGKWQDCLDCKRVRHGSSKNNAQPVFLIGCNFVPLLKPGFLSSKNGTFQAKCQPQVFVSQGMMSFCSFGPSINADVLEDNAENIWLILHVSKDFPTQRRVEHFLVQGTLEIVGSPPWRIDGVSSMFWMSFRTPSLIWPWSPEVHFLSDWRQSYWNWFAYHDLSCIVT